jgi:hypothetical protein
MLVWASSGANDISEVWVDHRWPPVYSEAAKGTSVAVAQAEPLHVGSSIDRNCSCSFYELFRCLFSSLMA